MEFTFTFDLPVPSTPTATPLSTLPATTPIFCQFSTAGEQVLQSASARVQAQARYRAKNKEQEQAKARERMHRLRDAWREETEDALKRKESSDRLRATPLFALYRVHAHTHITPIFLAPGETVDEYMEGYDRMRYSDGDFDEQDTMWHLRHSPDTLGLQDFPEDQVAACLGDLRSHHFRLDFKYTDERAVASYDRCLQGAFDDDNIEFLLRHQVPTPTMESVGQDAQGGETRALPHLRIPRGRGIPPKVRGLEVPKVVKPCDVLLRVSKEICLDCKQQKWLRTFQGRPLKVGRQVLEVYLQGLGGKVEVYLLEVRGFGGRGRAVPDLQRGGVGVTPPFAIDAAVGIPIDDVDSVLINLREAGQETLADDQTFGPVKLIEKKETMSRVFSGGRGGLKRGNECGGRVYISSAMQRRRIRGQRCRLGAGRGEESESEREGRKLAFFTAMLLAPNPPGTRPCCSIPYFPNPGVDRESHSDAANKFFYVVFCSHIPGTYTDPSSAGLTLMSSKIATDQVDAFCHGFRIKVARYDDAVVQWEASCFQTHGTLCPVAEAECRVLQAKVPQGTIGPSSTGIQFSKVQREFIKTAAASPALSQAGGVHPPFAVSRLPGAAPTVSAAFGNYLNAIGHSVPAVRVNLTAAAKGSASNELPSNTAASSSTSTPAHAASAFAQMGTGAPVVPPLGSQSVDAMAAAQKLQIPASDVFGDSDPAVVEAWCKRA
ncbi:hypothetical protein B0H13DRAFT_1907679 [Mycena leptocephala]|nr:hypothetical protein B0H13DRAFT_1907679 [Mycena leptocephala]